MHVETVTHHAARGWSRPLPSELDSPSTAVLAFAAPSYEARADVWETIAAAFPLSRVVGCSTAGEIHGTAIHDDTLALAVARFERTDLALAVEPVARERSFECGVRLGEALARPDLRGVLLIADGQDVNGSRLVEGLRSRVGDVPISGGLAGDGTRFKSTWVLGGGRARPGLASAIAFYGDAIAIGHGSKGGWDKFGPERRITRASGNVLYELDGRPALELYKSYLGDLAAGLPATALLFPLAIRASRADGDQVVRTVLSHSEAEQSLTFAGDMPEGALAQLMRANFDRLVEAAGSAALSATTSTAKLCVAVSCVGRRLVLGERAEDETEAVGEALPGCSIVGFYSYGEICPTGAGDCRLHNQTMTLTTFAER